MSARLRTACAAALLLGLAACAPGRPVSVGVTAGPAVGWGPAPFVAAPRWGGGYAYSAWPRRWDGGWHRGWDRRWDRGWGGHAGWHGGWGHRGHWRGGWGGKGRHVW